MLKGEKMKAPTKDKTRNDLQTWKHKHEQSQHELKVANESRASLREKLITEQGMLNLAWDAIQEAGYEDHSKELNDYINR